MFRSLDLFIAVAEEQNIGRAAARLHLSQPALTRQIQAIEDALGIQLFRRTTKGVVLTPAGESWLRHAQEMKEASELAAEEARRIGKSRIGRLDISAQSTAMLEPVPQILQNFRRKYPEAQVVLHNVATDEQIDALRHNRVQILFSRHFPILPDIEVELVIEEPLMVAMHSQHRLTVNTTVDLEDLRDEPLIGGLGRVSSSDFRSIFGDSDYKPRIAQRVNDLVSYLAMISGGFGVGFATPAMQALQFPNLVYRPLKTEKKLLWPLHCAYRKDLYSPAVEAFLAAIHEYRCTRQTPSASHPSRL